MIGTNLDKYAVLQKLGEGGMATVYRGRHQTLDRDVAIKVLHPHLSSSSRNRKRFEREAQAIEHLRHENILEIFDYSGIEGHDCYIVTEFVEGETLSALQSRRGRLPSEIVSALGADLCKALSYAHGHGVLHRDIKTDNVMLRVDGTLKLMDFGIARFLDETKVTMTGALVGSPAFMSPEQAREGPLDPRSDLFSLGTVLYALVTGQLPFTGGNPSLILKNVIEGNRPSVTELAPTVSPSLGDLIERLMATDPNDRPSTAADAGEELAQTLSEVRVDPTADPFRLVEWLRDPDPFEARLRDHLELVLLEEGKRRIAAGDQLGALRQFNRLLSMREDHPEVLALVQGLHGDPQQAQSPARRRWLATWIAAGSLGMTLAAVAVLAWFGASRPAATQPSPAPAPSSIAPFEAPRTDPPQPDPARPDPARPDPARPDPARPDPAPSQPAPAPAPPTRPGASVRPPPAPAPVPEVAPAAEPFAEVRFNTREHVADVYLKDRKLGTSRDAILLPAGTHRLVLKQRLFQNEEVDVTVAPGEFATVNVSLRPRPSRVTFPPAWTADCVVSVNGRSVGALGALGSAVEVQQPDQPVDLVVACPGGPTRSERYSTVPPGTRFPGLP